MRICPQSRLFVVSGIVEEAQSAGSASMNQPKPQSSRAQSPQPDQSRPEAQAQTSGTQNSGTSSNDSNQPTDVGGKTALPSWVISVVLHVVLIIVAAMTIQLGPVGMQADDSTTVGGEIVLKQMTDEGEKFFTEEAANALDQLADTPSPDPLSDAPSVTPSSNPLELDLIGATSDTSTASGGGGLANILGNPGQPKIKGHTSRTTFMSMEAEGNSFIYLIDRSASMGDGRRLNYAISQAKASLRHLNENTRFQILFYNDQVLPFRIPGKSDQMHFATQQNLALATRFLDGVPANSSTRSRQAIIKALSYGPDVIFFLSDSQSNLSYIDLDSIRRKNNGGSVSINVIEFAPSKGDPATNKLVELAGQNNGKYTFVGTGNID